MKNAEWDIDFDIERTMRYHLHRRGFYDTCHKVLMFAVVLSISAVFTELGQGWETVAAIIATLAVACELVFAPSQKARDHESLFTEFSMLAIRIRTEDPENNKAWTAERIRIETREHPLYHALNVYCYNETCRAKGITNNDAMLKIPLWRRVTRNLFRHAGFEVRPLKPE